MFSWLTPKVPLRTSERTWIERKLRWLIGWFGLTRLRRGELLLPLDAFFPDGTSTVDDPDAQLFQIAELFDFDASRLELKVVPDDEFSDVRDFDGDEKVIRITESQLSEPEWLVKFLGYRVSYQVFNSNGSFTNREPDFLCTMELACIFCGLGLFVANRRPLEEHPGDDWLYQHLRFLNRDHLTAQMSGYALACCCHLRGESDPHWAGWLRQDARTTLKLGLRYLRKANDILFDDESEFNSSSELGLRERLLHASPVVRLDAIFELKARGERTESLLAELVKCFDHNDIDVVANAIRLVADWPAPLPAFVTPAILQAMSDRRFVCRGAAFEAVAKHQLDDPRIVEAVACELRDSSNSEYVVSAALHAAEVLGSRMQSSIPEIVAIWRRGLATQRRSLCEGPPRTLSKVADDPLELIEIEFGHDAERYQQAKELFENRVDYESPAWPIRPYDVLY